MAEVGIDSGPVAGTRRLLQCGVVAGPFYLAVGVVQGLVRNGFDFARHPLSVLANGPGGWVQTANFAITGLLVLAAAAGIARAVSKGARGMTWALAGYGLCVFAAAFFPADPVDGFPPGTPVGMPTSISTTGLIHFAAGALGFTLLGVSALFAAWTFSRRKSGALATISLVSGLLVLGGFFGGMALGVVGIWIAVVVGWAWLAWVCLQLQRG